ncbi:MAG: dipeptide epimerase [Saprospiraceae bacterium]
MKIRSINFQLENLQLSKPYTIAWKTVDHVENLFCTIITDNGIIGYGSCNPENEVVNVSTRQTLEAKDLLDLDHIYNTSIDDPESFIQSLYPSLSKVPTLLGAIDLAVYDAWAKGQGKSLVDALGKKCQPLPTSVTIGIMNVEQTIAEAREFISTGFNHLKVKIGINPQEDIERLVKLRENFGDTIRIRTDVNQGYTINQFKELFTACASLDIELFEQPIRADKFEHVDLLDESLRKSIAADESLHNETDAQSLVDHHRCGIFNIKLMKCGGITAGKRIAQIAEKNSIDLMWGCNDESRLSIAAAMHLAYSSPNTKYLDLDGSFDLAKDLVRGGFEIKDGMMIPLDKPGLGVEWIG